MSFFSLLLFVAAGLILKFYMRKFFRPKKNYDEILRFFSPTGKFTTPEIVEIIKQRTSGKRDLSDASVRVALDQLSDEGKLMKETEVKNYSGNSIRVTRYYLPR